MLEWLGLMRLPSHGASSFADIDIPVSLVSPNVYMCWYKLLSLTPLRVAEVRVFGCGSIPEGTNRNIHFPGSSNNLPTSLGTYSQARTEHQQNPHKTAGHKTRLNLRKVPPNGTQSTQGNRIKLAKGPPLKQAKHIPTPVPRKDQHREHRTQANEPTRRRPTDTRQRTSHDAQGCQQGSSP